MSVPVLQFRPDAGDGVHVDLEALVAGRMLVQGSSGAGKSWLVRYLLEQTHGQIQQFIIDPEGEFATLREHFDYVVASADPDEGDVPADPKSAKLLCRQLVELGASAVLDIYELDPEDRELFVARFLQQLVSMPKGSWRPALVVVDEAHEFAPESGSAPPSKKPMELVVSKGRKRGLGAIYLTQRLSKLSKNASDLQNVLIGYTGLDTDVRRAGDILGFDKEQREGLKRLRPGEFYAFGPAITREVRQVRSGEIQTHHPKPGEIRAPTPPPRGALQELLAEMEDLPERAAEEERTLATQAERIRKLELELRSARNDSPTASAVDVEAIERRARADAAREAEQAVVDAYDDGVANAAARAGDILRSLLERVSDHEQEVRMAATTLASGAEQARYDLDQLLEESPRPASRPSLTSKPPQQRRGLTHQPTAAVPAEVEDEISPRHQRILDAARRLEVMGIPAPSRSVLAAVAEYSPRSSGYEKAVSRLSSLGLVRYPSAGDVALTPEGRGIAAAPDQPVTLEELHAGFFRILDPRHVRILKPLIAIYPRALSREELAERADYSALSSGYEKAVSRLSSFGLVHYPQPGHVAAAELLFPEGLR